MIKLFQICLFLFAALSLSCTHFIADTETRIQVENRTENSLYKFSVLSENGGVKILVPDTVEALKKSKVYESEFVGKFRLAIFSNGELHDLGIHELKGGSVLGQIREEGGTFFLNFK
ncbi:hypothetical protein AGMMS49938_15470 [Fibrobacterales bacterium]|nr:hypothetical protein AGMMS49938_15470 [Fibrobacterales bacterium]